MENRDSINHEIMIEIICRQDGTVMQERLRKFLSTEVKDNEDPEKREDIDNEF